MNTRIHFKEFIIRKPELRNNAVVQAGFKAFLKGIEWMTLDEWEEELQEYNNRFKREVL